MKLTKEELIDRKENGYYLSEATREVDFQYGRINTVIAPVGSGKTTYVADTLISDLEVLYGKREGLVILLAPYIMLRDQTVAEGLFNETKDEHITAMEGFMRFDDRYSMEEMSKIETGKIVMTPHKFFRLIEEENSLYGESRIMKSIDTLIIDEADHVFCRLSQWEEEDNRKNGTAGEDDEVSIFNNAPNRVIEYMNNVMIVNITATGENELKEMFGRHYQAITFREDMRMYKPKSDNNYSSLKLAFSEATRHKGKVGIYIESVQNMIKYREYLESLGYRVDMIVSDTAENYNMNTREKKIKEHLASKKGSSDLIGDILLFNASMERGVSIKDKSFTSIIVHSSNADTQTQVVGRFRFNGMRIWRLLGSEHRERPELLDYAIDDKGQVTNEITVPNKYMDTPLTTDMKNELIKDIGFSRKWTSLKKILIDSGYNIRDHTRNINKKRVRVSTITKNR